MHNLDVDENAYTEEHTATGSKTKKAEQMLKHCKPCTNFHPL
jgi:hypothetical protein